MSRTRKGTALITRRSARGIELCVFDHPRSGTQLPSGTLEPGEDPSDGALREAFEETGLADLRLGAGGDRAGVLAEVDGDVDRHLVHLATDAPTPDEWWVRTPDGGGMCWRCRWAELDEVRLERRQQPWLDVVRGQLVAADHPTARRAGPRPGPDGASVAIELFEAPPWSTRRLHVAWVDVEHAQPEGDAVGGVEVVAVTEDDHVVSIGDAHGYPTRPRVARRADETVAEAARRALGELGLADRSSNGTELVGHLHRLDLTGDDVDDGAQAHRGAATIDAVVRLPVVAVGPGGLVPLDHPPFLWGDPVSGAVLARVRADHGR
ncbi:MAG: NUDIX domain-containing protein [Actinomycetota bacterium]|nr:NUDIX domain-containing protein [Actinomycetota bacterium]